MDPEHRVSYQVDMPGFDSCVALEMMISTSAKGGRGESQFLSYPIVIHFIDHLYENGPCSIIDRDSYGVFTKLEAVITPR